MSFTTEAPFAVRDITKHFDGFTLGPLDLEVPRGYVMGLVGANGAGKTTAIKIGLGLIHPDDGAVKPVDKDRLGVVLDVAPYQPAWRAGQVGGMLSRFYPRWDQRRFNELLAWGGIDPDKRVKELSRGMSMRLQLAVAMAHQAQLLILDEPTSGLDPLARRELVEMLAEFMTDERNSVLFSTHITTDLDRLADYVTVLHHGQVLYSSARDDLIASFRLVRGTTSEADAVRPMAHGFRQHAAGWEAIMATTDTVALGDAAVVEPPTLDDLIVAFAKED